MSDSQRTAIPEEGGLDVVDVPRLLAQAWQDERTGLLQLAHGKNERRIALHKGAPVSIESPRSEDGFALFLENSGRIKAADRLEVERMAAERGCPHASAILALKLLDPKALYQAMRAETRSRIAETFDWQAGHYRWSDELSEEDATKKPLDILALFQEQLPRRWGTDRLFESIMSVQNVCGDISPRFRRVAKKLGRAGDPASRAIERLDGSRPLGQILGECAGDPLAAATLWTVLHTGVLRRSEGATRSASEAAELDFDVQVEVLESAAPEKQLEATEARAKRAKGEASGDTLREEIESLLSRLSDLDHYSALGLEENATAAHIKKAYFKAAKKYHPDSLARIGLDDLKEPAAQVFARIAEAFETLSDPHKRSAYDSGGSEEPEIDTARLAQAETSFRKGEILSKMGNFDGALDYLEPAVELWPDEPAYQAELGWALFRCPQKDLERATEHLEIALGQAPGDARIHLRLGLVLRAAGETNRANELTARARELDPDVED